MVYQNIPPIRAKILTFGGAFPIVFAFYVICQTTYFNFLIGKHHTNYLLSFTLLFSLLGVFILYTQKISRVIRSPIILVVISSALLSIIFYHDLQFYLSSLSKFIYLIILAQLYGHPLFDRALMFSADLVLSIVITILILAVGGVIPAEIFVADERVKFTGGFHNPNVAPFFLFSSLLIYLVFGLWRRAFFVVVIIYFAFFYLEISSATRLLGASFVMIAWACMRLLNSRIFYRVLSIVLFLLPIFGAFIYLLPFLGHDFLDKYVGGELDKVLSYRIWILANDFIEPTNGLLGFKLVTIDSTYSEIIYFAGPLFFILLLIRLLSLMRSGSGLRLQGVQLFLLGFFTTGLVESSLFTLTPMSLCFMIFIFRGHRNFPAIN